MTGSVFYVLVLVFVSALANSSEQNMVPKMKPLGEYSPSPFALEMEHLPDEATANFFIRKVTGNKYSAWEPVHPDNRRSASLMIFPASHEYRYQIRPVVKSGTDADMVRLSDFEGTGDQLVLWFESTKQVYRCDYFIDRENKAQGNTCLTLKVRQNEEIDINEDDLLGFKLMDRVPTLDWSGYRYLELYFWSDFPHPFSLLLKGEGESYEAPLLDYALEQEGVGNWHFIRVDLNEVFETTDERSTIQMCAFSHPLEGLKKGNEYTVRFDAMRLWKDVSFEETTVDATPPKAPAELSHQIKGHEMVWTWAASSDNESGIRGYAYSWSLKSGDRPGNTVMVTEPKAVFPFKKPNRYVDYHFKVMSCNKAGVWSEVVSQTVNFNPKNY